MAKNVFEDVASSITKLIRKSDNDMSKKIAPDTIPTNGKVTIKRRSV